MACIQPLLEKRPLKRPRLGPPDFYPQDPRQSEDDLTPDKLRNGYYYRPPFPNEYESAKQPRLEEKLDEYSLKIVQSYNAITAKKNEINALQDAAKKKPGAMREPFWHCAARPKLHDVWFRDLAGSKPLTTLAKKFPFFNKREEIFCTLSEFNIPMCRAIWFIKMTNAYVTQQQETGKIKKKQTTDPCSEWTISLTTFLRQLFTKLTDYYSPTSQTVLTADGTAALKQWQYCTKLGRYLFEEGLLDKQEFLTWMLEIFAEKCRNADEGALKLILPLLIQHLDGVLRSELLSRKLAHLCCKKLSHFYVDAGSSSPGPPSPNGQTQHLWYTDYLNCPYHRNIVYSLSAIVQAVIIECPTALVWNNMEMNLINSESSKAFLCGSPLDILPCFPSQLPIPQGPALESIVDELKRYESEVKRRSIAVDSHWSFDKCEQSGLGNMVSFILSTLDALDKHRYDRSLDKNNLETLYSRVFPLDSKELEEGGETTIVKLLCHWAVTAHRIGPHRALVVVRLLEKRQNEIQQQMAADGESENKNSSHYFQSALFEYLDTEAPYLDESSTLSSSKTNKVQFANLVLLFGELIRGDLFSHDAYLRTLISRGDLSANSYQLMLQHNLSGTGNAHANNNLSSSSSAFGDQKKFEEHDFADSKETEEPKLDIDKLLATIDRPSGSDYQGRLEKPPLSVGSSYPGSVDPQFPASVDSQAHIQSSSSMVVNKPTSVSRHYYNVLNFPIPQDDQYKHECNQRQTLLFGCGTSRDIQKSNVRKVTKELNKLWHKKNSVECSNGGQLKLKRKINLPTLKALTQKFRCLVFFDQYFIADSCADICLDQFREFTSGQTNYLPNVENLDYFFGLYEASFNFSGLFEFIEAIVALLKKVDNQLTSKNCSSAGNYVLNVAVCSVGYLTKHMAYLTFSNAELVNIWKLLFDLMQTREITTSAERIVFGFLFDVYNSCDYLRVECETMFDKIENISSLSGVCKVVKITAAKFFWDSKFAIQYFDDPKKEIDDNFLLSLQSPSHKFNFVANAVVALIAARRNTERLFELARFCADVTALRPALAEEWLGMLKALFCCKAGYGNKQEMNLPSDFIKEIDINDVSIHQPLAVLILNLVGRRCIKLEDFVFYIAMSILFPFLNLKAEGKAEAEPTVRLILHCCAVLCLCLESGDDTFCSSLSCSRLKGELYLVACAHASMPPQAILILLITILILGYEDAPALHDAGHSLYDHGSDFAYKNARTRSLTDYTSELLNHICQQEWIKNTFLQPVDLFIEGLLLNQLLKHTQAQKMLHMITRSSAENDLIRELEQCSSKKDLTSKILQNLSVWNLNVSLLDLELLLKQAAQQDTSCLADLIAKAAIDLFQAGENAFISTSPKKINQRNYNQFKLSDIKSGWLVAPLISKLPPAVQGKVLKAAALVLENGQLSRKEKSALHQSSSLLGQQPFLSLVLTCLRGQDDQRETLLSSLLKQLQEYVAQAKSDKYQFSSRENSTENREALQLRLSLVGGMFDTVCKGSSIENWALLLLQLLLYGVITIDFDRQLFYTCIDMLTILIHSCLIPDASKDGTERTVEECRRLHTSVTKKLKKEIGERYIPALKSVHQLLPMTRYFNEVVVCEPYGSQPSKTFKSGTLTNSPPALDPNARKGLQVTGKERISPWDLIEGYRGDNCGPKWSLFQAVKVDLQPDTVINQLNRLMPHDHYHHFKRPPFPGESRTDPYLEPMQVHYDQAKLHEMEKNARKDDSMTPVSQTGTDFADNLMSPTTKAALKAKKNVGGSSRGGRKNSRVSTAVAYQAPVMNVRGVPHGPMTPGPPMPMGYPSNPQQITPVIQPNASPYPQQTPGWSHISNPQMMPAQQPPMPGYQPRGAYPGTMMPQPHMSGMPNAARGALTARIRSRQPSGAVLMHESSHPVQVPRHQMYAQHAQHMVPSKVSDAYPNPNVQHSMQVQMEQHRQQLMNESLMEQQQQARPPLHRHVSGTTVEHVEPMQQQPMQQIPPGYVPQTAYAAAGNNRVQMMSNRQQSFPSGGYSNTGSSQNFGGQYFPSNTAGGQMRMPTQQNEMMVGTPRYSQPVNTGQMNYNMVSQPAVARNSGNFMMQQQVAAMGHQQQQMPMGHQQQQMPMGHQQPNQAYAAGNPQHFQQNSQQSGQIYPIQRMPSYSNLQMENQTPINYYQQQQQF